MKPILGSIVALITPMHEDGSVDYDTLRSLIDWHIAEGTDCIGVVGTTGESPTVNVEEHCEIIRVAVQQAAGRVPIMAGAGANSTSEAIELTRFAKKVGADCTLQVVPYYNKPTQEGIFQHFKAITEAVDIPTMLYNVPGRSVADMTVETMIRCASLPGVFGVKEATGNIERACWLIRNAPKGFGIYSGDDPTAVAMMLMGGSATCPSPPTWRQRAWPSCARPPWLAMPSWLRNCTSSCCRCTSNCFVNPTPSRSSGPCIAWARPEAPCVCP